MRRISVQIPQIGEGLQEARLVGKLKQVGERIEKDEPVYQMETDKAVMDIESPYAGVIVEWLAEDDELLPIGADIVVIETEDSVEDNGEKSDNDIDEQSVAKEMENDIKDSTSPSSRRTDIPPKTRSYAKQCQVSDEELNQIPKKGSKLLPEDIDLWLKNRSSNQENAAEDSGYQMSKLSSSQRLLGSRLLRGSKQVVPATLSIACPWEPVLKRLDKIQNQSGQEKVSAFTLFSYVVVQAVKEHKSFQSTITEDWELKEFDHLNLGVAVAIPGDNLVLAVVDKADTLSWGKYQHALRERINKAREGDDQAHASVTLSLSNMQGFGVRDAIPVVVPPASGTLFIGEVYYDVKIQEDAVKHEPVVNLTLSFDHRFINGVGAAQMLNRIRELVISLEDWMISD